MSGNSSTLAPNLRYLLEKYLLDFTQKQQQ